MKKLISVLISIIAVIAISTSFAAPAFAAITFFSPQGETITHVVNDPKINDDTTNKITVKPDKENPNIVTWVYTGDGKLIGWETIDKNGNHKPIQDGDPDYRIVSNSGNTLTLEILNWKAFESPDGYIVNAIVEGEKGSGSKDESSKSPNTGASLALASVAALGAGATIVALKKKDAE